jgi:hypothetical protein
VETIWVEGCPQSSNCVSFIDTSQKLIHTSFYRETLIAKCAFYSSVSIVAKTLIQARFRRTGRFDVSLCFLSKHYGWFEMPKITSWSLSRRMRAVGLSVSCHVAKSSVWRSASYKLKNNEQGESEYRISECWIVKGWTRVWCKEY